MTTVVQIAGSKSNKEDPTKGNNVLLAQLAIQTFS